MFCKNCGQEIDDKAVICPHCGVSQKDDSSVYSFIPFLASRYLHIFRFDDSDAD